MNPLRIALPKRRISYIVLNKYTKSLDQRCRARITTTPRSSPKVDAATILLFVLYDKIGVMSIVSLPRPLTIFGLLERFLTVLDWAVGAVLQFLQQKKNRAIFPMKNTARITFYNNRKSGTPLITWRSFSLLSPRQVAVPGSQHRGWHRWQCCDRRCPERPSSSVRLLWILRQLRASG